MTTQKERFRPKWENLQRLLARGVIPYSVWNFDGKRQCQSCGRKVAIIYPHPSGIDICCNCWRSFGKDGYGFNDLMKQMRLF